MTKQEEIKQIFEKDILTAQERFDTVMRLEEPDRVPLSFILYAFPPLHVGVKIGTYMADPQTHYLEVMEKIWQELGPWDIYYSAIPFTRLVFSYAVMIRSLWPGIELGENETMLADEFTYLDTEDYDKILKIPRIMADPLYRCKMMPRFCQEAKGLGIIRLNTRMMKDLFAQLRFWKKEFKFWREKGVVVQSGFQADMPFEILSFGRSLINFSLDLLSIPGKIGKAVKHLSSSFATQGILLSKLAGTSTVGCLFHRSSNNFISPKHFEELVLPGVELIVNRILKAGMIPVLHCDGDWLRNLKYLRKFPPKKIMIQFDGHTDIFRAKEEIGDHMCIFGNVPAPMLATGSPKEIEEYCHRLIEEVGKGGGFILASGCEVPPNARMENLKAMARAVKKYGYYQFSKISTE